LFLKKYTQSLEGFRRPRRKYLLKSNSLWSSIEEKALEETKRRRKSKKVHDLNNDSIDSGYLSS
jgi:hypothetical protein